MFRIRYFVTFIIAAAISLQLHAQWVQQVTGSSLQLTDIHFSDNQNGSACGIISTIIRTTNGGTNWVVQSNSIGTNLWGIWYIDAQTGFVVGDNVIAKTTNGGTNWASTILAPQFRGITFADANTGFAVGGNGSVFKTTNGGANWISQTSGVSAFLLEVVFPNSSTGFACGLTGTIIKTTDGGSNWAALNSGTSQTIDGIAFLNADTLYACGDAGTILKTTNSGINWSPRNSGTNQTLYDINFPSAVMGTVVGAGSTVLRTTNYGQNWIVQDLGLAGSTVEGVHFINNTTGYAVGSDGKIFYTITGGFPYPAQPNLIFPANGAGNVILTPLLKWDTLSAAKTYDVQVATDTGFTIRVIDTTLLDSAQLQVTAGRFINNTHYYWRARGVNIVGNGPWSVTFSFTTVVALPVAPILLTPANNASNVSLTPFFDWDSTSPALYYHLQVSSDSLFAASEVDYTNILESNFSLTNPQLQSNTRYFWRVSTTNAAGTGPWSAVSRFTTIITIPMAPILVSPPNNSNGNPLTPTLDWRDDITATSYQVQLSADSSFNTAIIDSTGFNVSQLTVRSGLLVDLVKYFWRVRTTNVLGTGPWSSVWNFRTGLNAPSAPVLRAPPNGATDISTILTLAWDSVQFADTYRIMISTDSTFATYLINASGISVPHYTTPGGALQNNTIYYWRVNATNNAGTGSWSAVWHFRTVISAPLAAPDLLSPANGATVTTLTPVLDWNDVVSTTGYRIQLAADSLFISPILDSITVPSQITVPSGRLSGNTRYYWRVRGVNLGGSGPWSVVWHFNTSVIGITTISTVIPKEFNLFHNFPNPFNPSTHIRFDIPRASIVILEIYDLLGKKVETLVNLQLQPGTYEAVWNASDFPSGVYFSRLLSREYVKTDKLLLVK